MFQKGDTMATNDHKKRFWKLAFILFLTEIVRGMFILSYLPALPTIGIISLSLSAIVITMHYVFDAVTNIWLGFLMRKIGAWWTMFLSYVIGVGAMVTVMVRPELLRAVDRSMPARHQRLSDMDHRTVERQG